MGTPPSLEGRLLAGRYRIRSLLGAGGMGAVYAAIQEDLNRRVAVKVLLGSGNIAPSDLVRFRQEALAAAELGHPHIVQVTDFQAWPNEPPILVMEMLEGESLRTLLTRETRLAPGRAVFIATQLLAALGAAHAIGVVHRDIKPPNVFVTRTSAMSDLVKVLDFGIAKVPRLAQGFVTDPGELLGTPAYMAPEQALGLEVDHTIDLYATGVCLFEMLTGRRPHLGATPGELIGRISAEAAPPLLSVAPEIDPRLGAVVDRALARDPRARPRSAQEMLEHLSPWSRTDVTLGASGAPAPGSPRTAFLPAMTPPTPRTSLPPTLGGSMRPAAVPTLPPPPRAMPAGSVVPPSPGAPIWPFLAIGAVVLSMLLVGALLFVRYRPLIAAPGPATPGPVPTTPSSPILAPDYWIVTGYVRPLVGDFLGDATNDVVLQILYLHTKEYRLALFDGRSNALVWTSPPIGDEVVGGRSAVAVGKRIAVAVSRGLVRIYDATTGRELRSASTTDGIKQLCRPAGAAGERAVWIETFDSSMLLDVETGVITRPRSIPQGCWSTDVFAAFKASDGLAPTIRVDLPEKKIDVLADGTIGVGVLDDTTGTHPVVGVSLSGKKVLWRLPGASNGATEIVDVVEQKAYVARASQDRSTIDCVDARTGSVLWSTQLGSEIITAKSIVLAGGRGYVNTSEKGLFILDAATGKVLTRIANKG